MRTWITLLIIISLIIGFSIYEYHTVSRLCSDIEMNVHKLEDSIIRNDYSYHYINEMNRSWHKYKKILYTFSNHNRYSKLEESFLTLDILFRTKDTGKLIQECSRLKRICKDIYKNFEYNIENIF